MDENHKSQETISNQPTGAVTDPVVASQSINQPQFEQIAKPEKPRLIISLLILFIITFWLGFTCLGFIIGDIRAGLLRGEPETGWGLMFTLFLAGPPLLIIGLITLFRARKLKRDGQQISETVWAAAIIAAVPLVISAVYALSGGYTGGIERSRNQQQTAQTRSEGITINHATGLLDSCSVEALHYGTAVRSEEAKAALAKSSEGAALVWLTGVPRYIYIDERAEIQLLPLAENAEEKCEGFSISGTQQLN